MLFKDYHIPMIRSGSKTVTRREWAENYSGPNVGTVVAAKTELLKPDDECDCFIRITGKREEYLGEITPASARREGDYESILDFREGYEAVYGDGSWDPDKVVTVVEFEYVGRSRPGDDGTEQTQLVTDGSGEFRDRLEFRRIEQEPPYRDDYALATKWNAGYPDEHHTFWEGHKDGFLGIFWASIKLAEREHPELIQTVIERNSHCDDAEVDA